MRTSKVTRSAALAAATCIFAVGGPGSPAQAQTTVDYGASSYESWPAGVPRPPTSAGAPPVGTLAPPGGTTQTSGCMQPNNAGTVPGKSWAQRTLGFERAWPLTERGQTRTVAVIDTGVNSHPNFEQRLRGGGDAVSNKNGLADCDGHGTMVAGIMGSKLDRQTGFSGVAPEANLVSIRQNSSVFKIPNPDNPGEQVPVGTPETMAQAIVAAALNGANVINVSAASCQPIDGAARKSQNADLQAAVHYAKTQHDAVVVAAAGNVEEGECSQKNAPGNPSTAVLPAWFDDDVLTVGAVNQQGGPAEFSNPGPWVDVAAPGAALTSLDPGAGGTGLATRITEPGENQPSPIQGTSFATPYVSGLVALVQERFPQLSPDQVMNRVKETAQHSGGSGGRNDSLGYGVIDPVAALTASIPGEDSGNPPHRQQPPARLTAPLIPGEDFTATAVALIGAGGGVAGLLATVFLVNAARRVRARRAAEPRSKLNP